jgi:hypothetical protein
MLPAAPPFRVARRSREHPGSRMVPKEPRCRPHVLVRHLDLVRSARQKAMPIPPGEYGTKVPYPGGYEVCHMLISGIWVSHDDPPNVATGQTVNRARHESSTPATVLSPSSFEVPHLVQLPRPRPDRVGHTPRDVTVTPSASEGPPCGAHCGEGPHARGDQPRAVGRSGLVIQSLQEPM